MEPEAPRSTWRDVGKVDEYIERVGRWRPGMPGERELRRDVAGRRRRGARSRLRRRSDSSPSCWTRGPVCARPWGWKLAADDRAGPTRFVDEPRVDIVAHDLRDALPELGVFDVVVSGFAIHHLTHDRKRTLFAEATDMLRPGGMFLNLEVVECASPRLQQEFHAVDRTTRRRPGGHPGPRRAAAGVDARGGGLDDVDCHWRWRGFALLAGRARHH